MKVKQRLRINNVVSAITALSILFLFAFAFHRVNNTIKASDLAAQILSSAFERVTFRNDYVRTNSERAKGQWFAKHEQIGRVIKSASEQIRDAKDTKILDEVRKDHEAIERIFSRIVENRKKRGVFLQPASLSQEIEDRLLGQLNMRLYEVVLHGRMLQDSARAAILENLKIAGGGILVVFVILSIVTLLNSWALGRAIAGRILRLQDGATMIGEGNLNHRIDITGDDEFTELSKAFNTMTSKLGDSYRDLENEIEVRKQAEEDRQRLLAAVQRERDRLSALVNSITDEIWFADAEKKVTLVNPAVLKEFGSGISDAKDVERIAANFEVYRPDGTPRPVDEAPPLRALRGETVTDQEEIVRTPASGQLRHRQINAAPVRDPDGAIIGSVSVVRDITERKRAEEQIQRHLKELQALNEELTRFNRVAVGRELRMIELKKEVNELCAVRGEPPRYRGEFEKGVPV